MDKTTATFDFDIEVTDVTGETDTVLIHRPVVYMTDPQRHLSATFVGENDRFCRYIDNLLSQLCMPRRKLSNTSSDAFARALIVSLVGILETYREICRSAISVSISHDVENISRAGLAENQLIYRWGTLLDFSYKGYKAIVQTPRRVNKAPVRKLRKALREAQKFRNDHEHIENAVKEGASSSFWGIYHWHLIDMHTRQPFRQDVLIPNGFILGVGQSFPVRVPVYHKCIGFHGSAIGSPQIIRRDQSHFCAASLVSVIHESVPEIQTFVDDCCNAIEG